MRDCNNIVNNGIEEETPDNGVKCFYKEVVIVGECYTFFLKVFTLLTLICSTSLRCRHLFFYNA